MEHNKLIIKDVETVDFNNFIKELKKNHTLKIKGYKPATEKVMQERFAFSCEFDNISIVYETKARCIIITAADYLLSLLHNDYLRVKENRQNYSPASVAPVNMNLAEVIIKRPPTLLSSSQKLQSQPQQNDMGVNIVIKPPKPPNQKPQPPPKKPQPNGQTEILAPISKHSQKPNGRVPDTHVNSQKSKPPIVNQKPPSPSQKKPQQKTKKAIETEKKLKKLIPTAFELLCEQSKTDFIIGMTDISNDFVRLSDYSMLLVPLYRALERLIFDLQQVEGINVKMIGQGYEKDDMGRYILKSGYQKRIGSIVYAEVMAALYTEYFEKRNFYAHSDITGDALSRVITDKAMVKDILAKLAAMVEYNAKKLKEIGFSLNKNS